jgi:hypothetical protein
MPHLFAQTGAHLARQHVPVAFFDETNRYWKMNLKAVGEDKNRLHNQDFRA